MNFQSIYLIGLVITASIIALFIILYRIYFRQGEEPTDNPLFENYIPQYSGGHSDGVVEKVEFSDNKVKVTFYPRDINWVKTLKKKIGMLKPYVVYYMKDKLVSFSEGSFSSHRTKLKGFPHDSSLLPDGVKRTDLGKGIIDMIEKRNQEDDENKILRKRLLNQEEILSKTAGLDITKDLIKMQSEINEEMVRGLKKEDHKIIPPINPNRPR